jgi:hypothetical protein
MCRLGHKGVARILFYMDMRIPDTEHFGYLRWNNIRGIVGGEIVVSFGGTLHKPR